MTCLRTTFRAFKLESRLSLRGTALIFWDYHGALGPSLPQSDATLHPLAHTCFRAIELSPAGWKVTRVDERGVSTTLFSGNEPIHSGQQLCLECNENGAVRFCAEGRELWSGSAGPVTTNKYPGALGLWVQPNTHLRVDEFQLRGKPIPVRVDYLGMEALLGAGEPLKNWQEQRSTEFRHGLGWLSKQPQARVKWNVIGKRFTLWSPRGPDFGEAEIHVDGKRAELINLHARQSVPSMPVWRSEDLRGSLHAVVWQARASTLPVDCLQAEQ
jgi:hypothetical protein